VDGGADVNPAPVDHLAAEAQALEDAFYRQGRLEADKWERLSRPSSQGVGA
jgi:hypothetical protein